MNRIRPQRTERILVVDDEPWTTELIAEQLSVEGFQVDTTNVSARVMDILASRPYDLVILDIGMPPPDGMDLLKEILQAYPFMAVLMLTAFSDAKTATQAMREGASDYIVKPHRADQLVVRVERALERSRLLREREQARQLLAQRVEEQTRQLTAMLERVKEVYQATLKALEAALDTRDHSAPGHCRRVARLAVRLGKRMGITGHKLVALEHGALLHDIGKLGIPDYVLLKNGALTEDEWRIVRKHPEYGCQIVGHIDFLKEALPIILHHHEHYDGTGYPKGLKGKDIPLLARIFSVVDAFDALTNQRPYNQVRTVEMALQDLEANKGRLFDPQIVDEFVAMIREQGVPPSEQSLVLSSPPLDVNGYLELVGAGVGHELQLQDEEVA